MPPSQSDKTRIAVAFACVYLFWGSTYGAIHVAGLQLAPPLVGALRTLLASLILAGYCVARGISLRVSRRAAWQLALVGVLFMTVNNLLLVWAETKVASGYASLVIAMIPIMVALIETSLPEGDQAGRTCTLIGWVPAARDGSGMLVTGSAVALVPRRRTFRGMAATRMPVACWASSC